MIRSRDYDDEDDDIQVTDLDEVLDEKTWLHTLKRTLKGMNPFNAMNTFRKDEEVFSGKSKFSKKLWRYYLNKSELLDSIRPILTRAVGPDTLEHILKNNSKNIFLWLWYWARRWVKVALVSEGVIMIPVTEVQLGGPIARNARNQLIYPVGYRPRYVGMNPAPQGVELLRAFSAWDQYIAGVRRTAEMDVDIYNRNDWESLYRYSFAQWRLEALQEPWRHPEEWQGADRIFADPWRYPEEWQGADGIFVDPWRHPEEWQEADGIFADEAREFVQTLSSQREAARLALTTMMRSYPSTHDGVINVGCIMCSNKNPQNKCQACEKPLCGQVCFYKHSCD